MTRKLTSRRVKVAVKSQTPNPPPHPCFLPAPVGRPLATVGTWMMKLGARTAPSLHLCPCRCWGEGCVGEGATRFQGEAPNRSKFAGSCEERPGQTPSGIPYPSARQRARPAHGRVRPSLPPPARPPDQASAAYYGTCSSTSSPHLF